MGAILNVIAASGSSFTPVTNTYIKVAVIAAAGAAGTATLSFQNSIGYTIPNGTSIVVSGLIPAGYNGTYTVTGGSNTSVQYANATTGGLTGTGAYLGTVSIAGSGTETVPTGATSLIIRMYGGGGSGTAAASINYGAGGGGGAQITSTSLSVTGGQTITYSVGAPGLGVTSTTGTTGGNTTVTFTSVFVATANGGGGASGTATPGSGGTANVTTGTATSANPGSTGVAGGGASTGSGGAAGTGGLNGGGTQAYSGAVAGNNLGGGSPGTNAAGDTFAAQGGAGFISFSYT